MNPQFPRIQVHVDADWSKAFVGEWFPIAVSLSTPAESSNAEEIRFIGCSDKNIQLDTDFFQRQIVIAPGETYRFVLRIYSSQARTVILSDIYFPITNPDAVISLESRSITFRPSIGREIVINQNPICTYGNATKMEITLHHQGSTTYEDFSLLFTPESAIVGGKAILRRSLFQPGEEVQLHITATSDLQLTIQAKAGDTSVGFGKPIMFAPISPRQIASYFQFLEPTRLTSDQIEFSVFGTDRQLLGRVNGAFLVQGGTQYQLLIRPEGHKASEVQIEIEEIHEVAYAKNGRMDEELNAWVFELDIIYKEWNTKSERVFYKVKSSDGTSNGEIPLRISPPSAKHWKMAIAIGAAATVQGIAAVVRAIVNPDITFTNVISESNFTHNLSYFLAVSIFVLYGFIRMVDWFWFRINE